MDPSIVQPTVLGASWRHRWLVLGFAGAFAAVALILGLLFPADPLFEATGSLLVQQPDASSLLASSDRPERFVANQIEILQSGALARRVLEGTASELSMLPNIEDYFDNLSVTGLRDANLIEVTYKAINEETAVVIVNALVSAYAEFADSQTAGQADAAVANIDAQLEVLDARRLSLRSQISNLRAEDVENTQLDNQYDQALLELIELQAEANEPLQDSDLDEIRARLTDLRLQIDTYNLIQTVGQRDSELAALTAEQTQILGRRATLLQLRDDYAIQAELAPPTVTLFSPASFAREVNRFGLAQLLAAGLVLGLLAGTTAAYLMAVRRRAFTGRLEPEVILGAPLLADIPSFSEEGITSRLPVRDEPRSAAAEAFRFAATTLELRLASQGLKSLLAISSTLGHGKTTALVNIALAAAREGHRVLVVDADFGNQDVTEALTGETRSLEPGLTDVIETELALENAIRKVHLGNDVHLSLLSRGQQPVIAADLLKSPRTRAMFKTVREDFDLVLVDAPPLLQVAYSNTLVGYVDAALVIVRHGGSVSDIEEVEKRLRFIGTPTVGYLYNQAPLRAEMMETEGSMMDILGDSGLVSEAPSRFSPRSGSRKPRQVNREDS